MATRTDPSMSPVQFSLKAALLAMLLFAIASALLSQPIQHLDSAAQLRAGFLLAGIFLGSLAGAGMASITRARILRVAGKRLLLVPARNPGVLAMKIGMGLIVLLWCALVWVFSLAWPAYLAFLSVLIAFPIRWLCRFPRYLELFEHGVVYGGTVYFPWKRFRTFRFAGNTLQLDLLLDLLSLSVATEYLGQVDEILSQHIDRWQPPHDRFT